MIVDSHCHLNMLDLSNYDNNLDNVITAATENGVETMLCVSVDLPTLPDVLSCAQRYPNVYASVGVHPNDSQEVTPVEKLVELANAPKVVAIGETGLDYFRSEGDLSWQRDAFRTHIRAAKQLGLPVIIHTRDAREDTIKLMAEENIAEVGGVLHCFTESWDMAQAAMDMGFYVSFSGIVTFKNAKELQEVAKKMPLDRMLIETDSPFLAPVPFRGKPNYPAYVRNVGEFIAELRDEPFELIAKHTTENFYTLFNKAQ
jgi:TatD DNase family protein